MALTAAIGFTRPDDIENEPALRCAWQMGWQDAFDREDDDDEPLPADWLDLESICRWETAIKPQL